MFNLRVFFAGLFIICVSAGLPNDRSAAEEIIQGTLIANHLGTVSSEITGERAIRVMERPVQEGDRVKKGQLLAKLSTVQLVAALNVILSSIDEAKALVGVAESNLAGAQLRFNREAGLRNSVSFRRARYEDSEVALISAKSELQSAQSVARLRVAEADRIKLEIRLAEILAPYNGVVVDILTNVGASVTQNNPHILKMLDTSRIEIEVAVLPIDLARFPMGRELRYSLRNNEIYTAKVRAILPSLDNNKERALVRLELSPDKIPRFLTDQLPVQVYLKN